MSPRCSRRIGYVILSGALLGPALPVMAAPAMPTAARSTADPYATLVTSLLSQYHLPGGSLAVMKDGRLVYAKGFGLANVESHEPATAKHLFRIGSVSKPLTAVAVLKLVEQGKLSLDDKVFDRLKDFPLPKKADPRLRTITVRDLLQHSGGWDQKESTDPQFETARIARELGLSTPASARSVIRYMLDKPLDFDPGTRMAYSNLGYNLLGRLIEQVTGQRYEAHVLANVLRPMGIRHMRLAQATRGPGGRDEVLYYAQPPETVPASAVSGATKQPVAIGNWSFAAIDAHGGWLATSVDLLRFARGVFGYPHHQAFLSPASRESMGKAPAYAKVHPAPSYYALGWIVEPQTRFGQSWSHAGALKGSSAAYLRYYSNGFAYAAVFNSLPKDYRKLFVQLSGAMEQRLAETKQWPAVDHFAELP